MACYAGDKFALLKRTNLSNFNFRVTLYNRRITRLVEEKIPRRMKDVAHGRMMVKMAQAT